MDVVSIFKSYLVFFISVLFSAKYMFYTFLVNIILSIFEALVNINIFLILFLVCSLLIGRNTN